MTLIYLLLALITIFFIAVFAIGYLLSSPAYKGPVTDHFDGKRFKNIGGAEAKGFKEVFKWLREGRAKKVWKEDLTPAKAFDLQAIEADRCRVSFINHSTFLIEIAGLRILTDPIWSAYASPFQFAGPKRMKQPGFTMESLGRIDYVLLTHNHYDHCDLPALKTIDRLYQPPIVTTLGVDLFLKQKGFQNVITLDWWDSTALGPIKLTCTPAQHFSSRGLFDRNKTLWCGFALKTDTHQVYYAGDSGYGAFFKEVGQKFGQFDLSMIPIGAYKPEWFMQPIHVNPTQAIQIHRDVRSIKSIACHFGTFPLAEDSMLDPVNDLSLALERNGLGGAFVVIENGESVVV